ncbi:MarR family winged helix-turn-helix transcriptional regulator [Goodfellowiella coeruleoviolacea]|uniref:DNA-binding transcriptional regulator, MarR family n=1 Tax=Goodfellowiella coeruleoviolacea TaxID=334858 RepID=A0AAE3GBA4_9PSEU|nr:MarR family transcriptional regulator [Goodfellowiella coeruleoviolacea]MCP2163919.1 DNA-binding transcriptional regulator, MarR family [Goodfellowiella coeruleoviolacea]
MSSDQVDRSDLVTALQQAVRDNATWGLLLHQEIAARFGLNPTDLKCLELARREHELTAGRLAGLVGLSASAVTAVLDRLERAGFVQRRRDQNNRRRVFVLSTGRHEASVRHAYAPLAAALREHLERYDDQQLALLLDFTRHLGEITRDTATDYAGAGTPLSTSD